MVFNRIEELENKRVKAEQVVGSVHSKLSKLLVERGTNKENPFVMKQFAGSQTYWELGVTGLRRVEEEDFEVGVAIRTLFQEENAEDPSRGRIEVTVQSQERTISYLVDGENPRLCKKLVDQRLVRGWEPITDLDDEFFSWVDSALEGADR